MRYRSPLLRQGLLALLLTSLLASDVRAQATSLLSGTVITGTVVDAQDRQPLLGATLVLTPEDTTAIQGATTTDAVGRYRLEGLAPGRYRLTARFVGYQEQQIDVTLEAGTSRTLDLALEPAASLAPLVVTASRQREKVLDAPASVSVLVGEEVERPVVTASVDLLRHTTGVDFAQTGINRREVVLRGFNNAFSGATYVMTDYRQAAVPSLGVNIYSIMPNMAIDLERVEVVRGPGSALYGAGVDAGVIHFITKDPFSYPGTTISVTGGERSLFSGQLRHAGVLGGRLGYKVTGSYAQARDWELDPSDAEDAQAIADDLVARDYDHRTYNVNGLLQYRLGEDVTLTANVGRSSLTATVLSGIGTVRGDGFGYTYGQLRLRAGGLFAQLYLNRNSAGDSFIYATDRDGLAGPDPVVDKSMLYNAQAQYDFQMAGGRQRMIVGVDAELTRPDTDGTITGRNEHDDDINELGAYLQSTTALRPDVDLTLALRGDYNNVVDAAQLSPRAALVYKPTPQHAVRATYNRAFASPGTNSLFLDIPARVTALPGDVRFIMQGRGGAEGFTFDAFRSAPTARFFLPVPGLFGTDLPVAGIPLQPLYALALEQMKGGPLPAPLDGLPAAQQAMVMAALAGFLPHLQGTTEGVLGVPADEPTGYRRVSGPTDIAPLKQSVTQTIELGYKGLFGDRLLVTVDAYYTQKKNFVGPLGVESPLVYVPELGADLAAGLAPVITAAAANDPQLGALLASLGLTPEQAAALIGQMAGAGFNQPTGATAVAVVQPDQAVLAGSDPRAVGGLLTYRNFGRVRYYGVDLSSRLLLNERWTLFGNLSLVSDDFFDNKELEEANTDLSVALNAPVLKVMGGLLHSRPAGVSAGLAGRYIEGFPVRSGLTYIGEVESYFLLDLQLGYELQAVTPGLEVDLTVQNVLDHAHREFVGAPKMGRLAMARLTYTF